MSSVLLPANKRHSCDSRDLLGRGAGSLAALAWWGRAGGLLPGSVLIAGAVPGADFPLLFVCGLQDSISLLLEAVRTKNEELAQTWKKSEQWATIEQLCSKKGARGRAPSPLGPGTGPRARGKLILCCVAARRAVAGGCGQHLCSERDLGSRAEPFVGSLVLSFGVVEPCAHLGAAPGCQPRGEAAPSPSPCFSLLFFFFSPQARSACSSPACRSTVPWGGRPTPSRRPCGPASTAPS